MTTMGLSSQVTVHMPSSAWKITTARVSTAARDRSMLDQRSAASSRMASPPIASTLEATCSPRMYRGMASATSAEAVTTWATPRRWRRAASSASASTSTPNRPARKRCTCSRQALWLSSGRISLATCCAASTWVCGQVTRP